jgi:hypothetical protein
MSSATAAAPSPRNTTSARRFVADVTGYYEAGLRTQRQATTNANHAIAQVKRACPAVIPAEATTGSKHQQAVAKQVLEGLAADLYAVIGKPVVPVAVREAAALERLHLGSRRANRDAGQMARSLRLIAALQPSDVCAALRAAAADSYQSVPAATRRLVTNFTHAFGAPTPSSRALKRDLEPFLPARRDRAALTRISALTQMYGQFTAGLVFVAGLKLDEVLTGTTGAVPGL